ncbi:hypothetical protein Pla52n_20870 [Stieleria varia]|uniref:Uncharacterized protein n=2 Tax=Stieleria varia TaxID=2528005 RepID=A0A5C6B512_9BACT|nr:hypothetical protein Pla52n_20870 [Stieleria varia]
MRFSLAVGALLIAGTQTLSAQDPGVIKFKIQDEQSRSLPCRIHLFDEQGESVKVDRFPYWNNHFVCPGTADVAVPPGRYSWQIERGPEHSRLSGDAFVQSGKTTDVSKTLRRIANLKEEGWVGGDLHVHRPITEIKELMLAEDLHFAPVIGWWNTPAPDAIVVEQTEFRFDEDRIYCSQAGEDEREGGALLYFGLNKQLDLSVQSREFPSPMQFVEQARQQNQGVWVDVEKPFWWDMPTWLASGNMNSMGLAHNHMHRTSVLNNEAWGRPRDSKRLPGPHGNGLWSQEIYYHLLNTGIRIPPSAGSASGVLPNPVGYNRVYVHLADEPFTRDSWFAGLQAGRCFVTNGPLLRVAINDTWPGTVLALQEDALQVEISLQLTSNDPVSSVEVVHNGAVIKQIPCEELVDQPLNTSIAITEPGWILVRAIADVDHTFRFASTAPWYIESDSVKTRVSRTSTQFFLDWVNERIERVNANVPNAIQRDSVLRWHLQAREFWIRKRENANAK